MIAPRWRKVLRDLWNNKSRTLLVVFSIAIGVAAIGMVASTNAIITSELPASYTKIHPTHARVFTSPFDDDLILILGKIEGVDEVEGRLSINVRLQINSEEWRDLELIVMEDFNDIRINKITPESGKWPPEEGELLIERASLILTESDVGEHVLIETPNGKRRELKIVGLAHDLTTPAGTFTNLPKGYISFDTLKTFGYDRTYNELLVRVEGDSLSREYISQVMKRVESKIEKGGRTVGGTIIPNPGQHWFETYLAPISAVLIILGIVILLLSALLIINTITAIMAQQVRQIGMMKSVGATTSQVVILYETSMFLIGLLALIISIPLATLGTRFAVNTIIGIINFDVSNINIPSDIILLQFFLCVLVPMVVALVPILRGAGISVHEAINDYGLNRVNFGEGSIDQVLSYIRGLPRPLLLSLRNTFRQKSRLILTIIALTLGSAIFIAVMSVYSALITTLDEALGYYGFDIVVTFSRPYRIEQIEAELDKLEGITSAENWGFTSTRIVNADGSETNTIILVAPPTETELINPSVLAGRWLLPEDEQAIVINTEVLREAPDVRVGHEITMTVDGTPKKWLIVGIVRSVMTGPMAYTNYPYFSRVMGRYGLASSVYLATDQHDQIYQDQMARTIEEHFERVGINVSSISKVAELRATAINQFNVIFIFLIMMAILLTIVGGFGLTGTMSLNVIERTREIGVMRAIGASDGTVMRIVIVEGVLIGIISWILGVFLAYPIGWLLSQIIGGGFLQSPLIYTYSLPGALIWLLVVSGLATFASFLPARNATRLPVRDVLAYE